MCIILGAHSHYGWLKNALYISRIDHQIFHQPFLINGQVLYTSWSEISVIVTHIHHSVITCVVGFLLHCCRSRLTTRPFTKQCSTIYSQGCYVVLQWAFTMHIHSLWTLYTFTRFRSPLLLILHSGWSSIPHTSQAASLFFQSATVHCCWACVHRLQPQVSMVGALGRNLTWSFRNIQTSCLTTTIMPRSNSHSLHSPVSAQLYCPAAIWLAGWVNSMNKVHRSS